MHVCVSGNKKCLFFGKFGGLCFLVTPVLRFALLPYYRRDCVIIRTLDENFNVQNVPWTLTIIPRGYMDKKKLASQLLAVISKLNKFQKDNVDGWSAFLKEI